ncbi:uncharacterized protein LOC101745261 isoform X1 [Bombyx mori]|uniref:Uncharacterized protein n=1 Tax=Bombyx mori TaxID=7091 RepID=A0A8R1WP36_BOMMO|nr:uncharacterized protein LOC101745261 [Bombyx mori]
MCSNETLVDQLECYVDDLVECFEDFVKKSLIVITIAVGAVIGLLVYVLKMVTERQEALSHASIVPALEDISRQRGNSSDPNNIPTKTSETVLHDYEAENTLNAEIDKNAKNSPDTSTKSANTLPLPVIAGFDAKVLRDIGLSDCSKNCKERILSLNRDQTNKRSTSLNKNQDTVETKTSCCSICCEDEDTEKIKEKDILLPS